jgi:RNA recognition motif-containing protein
VGERFVCGTTPTVRGTSHDCLALLSSPFAVTEEEFRTFFQRFGKLIDCIVMVDRDTNRSRGFGFVSYEDPEVAKELLAKGNDGRQPSPESDAVGRLEMRGKMIEIKAAQPRDVAPNRRHYNNRSMDQRRPSSSTPSVPSMGADHNATHSAFVPAGYEYTSPTYYPYLYPPATSAYMSSGYYHVMSSSSSGGDMAYPTSFAPSFGYDVSAAYSPYHNYPSHPYATSASASSPPHLQARKPLIHTSSPGASVEETSASTGAV